MPDMQTALKEALNEWSDSAGRHQVEKQQPTPLPEVAQMQTATPDTQDYVPAATQRHGDGLRNIFAYIKDYPSCSISDLKNAGFIEGTTASAIHRLYMAGKITRTTHKETRDSGHGPVLRNVYRYSVAVDNFSDQAAVVPNPLTTKKKIVLRKKHPAAQPVQGIAALPTEKTPEESARIGRTLRPAMETFIAKPETANPIPANITAEYVIKHISLSEAVKLHAELKKMLG
jgi:hypothetical protein